MECAFCNVSNINLGKFYENDLFVAIYVIRPVIEGHCLVIPKRHVESFLSLNDEEKKGFAVFVERCTFIALKFSEAYQFDLLLQEGENAGQSVQHMHLHIIPRKKDDVLSKRWDRIFAEKFENTRPQLTKEETEKAVKKLRFIAKQHAVQLESF